MTDVLQKISKLEEMSKLLVKEIQEIKALIKIDDVKQAKHTKREINKLEKEALFQLEANKVLERRRNYIKKKVEQSTKKEDSKKGLL